MQTTKWPTKQSDPIHAYDCAAERYDKVWRRYTEESLDRVVRLVSVAGGEQVLDVACGTGELARRLVTLGKPVHVQGVDGSEAMVRVARTKFKGTQGVSFHRARADHLPVPDAVFDWITCSNSFHCFDRPDRVMSEMRRVLKPQGRLLIMDWCRNPWHCRIVNWWKVRFDPSHVWMYTLEELADLTQRYQLNVRHTERFRVSWLAGIRFWDMMIMVAG